MDLDALIAGLGDGRAYAGLALAAGADLGEVAVERRRGSVRFDVADRSYELCLAALDLGPAQARARCEALIAANWAFAPGVHLEIVPVFAREPSPGPRVRVGAPASPPASPPASSEASAPLTWMVASRRLPPAASFGALLDAGRIGRPQLWVLAELIAGIPREGDADSPGGAEAVDLIRGASLRPSAATFGEVLSAAARALEGRATRSLLERLLVAIPPATVEALAAPASPAASLSASSSGPHAAPERPVGPSLGDLRLDDLYQLSAASPADAHLATLGRQREWILVDRFDAPSYPRWRDPLADLGALVAALKARGRRSMVDRLVHDYARATGTPLDPADSSVGKVGRSRLGLHVAVHALERARAPQIEQAEDPAEGPRGVERSPTHWPDRWIRLALGELAPPTARPCLVLVAGLPGVGKSVLARSLRETAGFAWIWADQIRKRLTDPELGDELEPSPEPQPGPRERIYSACLERAADICRGGGRALVDASFIDGNLRERFIAAANHWGVPAVLLVVDVPPAIARSRILARDESPADREATWAVHVAARRAWTPVNLHACPTTILDGSGDTRSLLAQASWALTSAGLL